MIDTLVFYGLDWQITLRVYLYKMKNVQKQEVLLIIKILHKIQN